MTKGSKQGYLMIYIHASHEAVIRHMVAADSVRVDPVFHQLIRGHV